MLESMFRNLSSEALLDVMEAYDAYIYTACESRLIDTGWKPVGICEFYENEYQTAGQKDKDSDSFDYMYKVNCT